MSKSIGQVEELHQGAIDQDSKARGLYIIHDQVDSPIMELKVIELLVQGPACPIISALHVQFDCHQALINGGML